MLPLFVDLARAADLHVTPDGSPAGDGSETAPLDLQSALSGAVPVGPGDTIWLHGGTYGDGGTVFTSSLVGYDYAPVVVRGAEGVRATVDGGVEAHGAHTWFWGFEITSSRPDRQGPRRPGLTMAGEGTKAIDLLVHDAGDPGIALVGEAAESGEVYGCVVWGNGVYDPVSGLPTGDGVGLVGAGGAAVRDVIAFRNFGRGIAVVGTLEGYVAFDNGGWNLSAVATGEPTAGLAVLDGFTWRRPEGTAGSVELGGGAFENGDALVTGNRFVIGADPDGMVARRWTDLVVRDNQVAGEGTLVRVVPALTAAVDWDGNGYWTTAATPFVVGEAPAAPLDWDDWRSTTGFDATSGRGVTLPTEPWLSARVNVYEGGRAHVIVHGWGGATTVPWDPTGWLTPGRPYRVHDAQDFYGPPVAEGVFDGAPILLPTDLVTVAPLLGDVTHLEDRHTAPAFAVFVVLRDPAPIPTDTGDTAPPTTTGDDDDDDGLGTFTRAPHEDADANRTRCGCAASSSPSQPASWLASWAALVGVGVLRRQNRRKPVTST